ncbi:hypothetical protein BDR04DRAFT_1111517, partial [Suillus decipiens]
MPRGLAVLNATAIGSVRCHYISASSYRLAQARHGSALLICSPNLSNCSTQSHLLSYDSLSRCCKRPTETYNLGSFGYGALRQLTPLQPINYIAACILIITTSFL